jgi:hypothetical protein
VLDGPGSECREARFFAPVPTDPGAHPASCTIGTESFPGVKRPACGADHPPPHSAKVENEQRYTSTPPLGPSWPVTGRPLPLPLPYISNKGLVAECEEKENVAVTVANTTSCFKRFLNVFQCHAFAKSLPGQHSSDK